MKILTKLFLIFCILFLKLNAFSKDIVFIHSDRLNPASSAILNGLRDGFKDMKSRFGKSLNVQVITTLPNPQAQADAIASAYVSGAKAVVVFALKGDSLKAKISELNKKSFPIVAVGNFAENCGAFYAVKTDSQKMTKSIESALQTFTNNGKLPITAYFYSETQEDFDTSNYDSIKQLLPKNLNPENCVNILKNFTVKKLSAFRFYSDYALENKIEISRYDNYGAVFFNPKLLENTIPLPQDSDRRFVVCVGALPQFASYIKNKQINLCIYDDFYGWGYFTARTLSEKIFENKNPSSNIYKLPPIEITPSSYQLFISDWKKWLK